MFYFNEIKNKFVYPKNLKIRLGIWGTRGSGKTTYIAMLLHNIQKGGQLIIEPDGTILAFVRETITKIRERGEFPAPTPTNIKHLEITNYTLKPNHFCDFFPSEIKLEFIDAPGEFYEDFSGENKIICENSFENCRKIDIIDYLMSCDGIIFLLDPLRKDSEKSYQTLLIDLFDEFKFRYEQKGNRALYRNKIPQYMAFCVTKVDEKNLMQRKQGLELAKEVMGEDLFKSLESYLYFDQNHPKSRGSRCNFYGLSSVGIYFEHEQCKSPVIYQQNCKNSSHIEANKLVSEEQNLLDVQEPISLTSDTNDTLFESWGRIPNTDESAVNVSKSNAAAFIKKDVDLKPVNVTAPIIWLIRNIQANPPFSSRL